MICQGSKIFVSGEFVYKISNHLFDSKLWFIPRIRDFKSFRDIEEIREIIDFLIIHNWNYNITTVCKKFDCDYLYTAGLQEVNTE